jgi:hypothetical protein
MQLHACQPGAGVAVWLVSCRLCEGRIIAFELFAEEEAFSKLPQLVFSACPPVFAIAHAPAFRPALSSEAAAAESGVGYRL